jgi:abortive infection bacteriophage resistance protein
MQKDIYECQFLDYKKQIALLKERGLHFNDEKQALDLLEKISYYRLSSYWHPFLKDKQKKIFIENANFDNVSKLYDFDADLRKIVMAELGKIEVVVRSKMVHILSLANDTYWLEKKDLFSSFKEYVTTASKIIGEVKRSDESFIIDFKNKYSNEIPPAFMVIETTTFGTLSKLYKNLKVSEHKREIAHFFNLSIEIFESWLHSLSYVRNICAHHSRLWNKRLQITPKTNKNIWLDKTQNCRRIYIILSIIAYLLKIINPERSFKQELDALFLKYPSIDKIAMGFPDGWEEYPLWS